MIMKTRRPAAQRQRTPTCAPAPLAIHSTAGATQPVPPSSLTILPLLRQSYGLRTGTRWTGPGGGMLVTRPTPVRGPRATAKSAAPLGIHTDAADTLDLTLIREEEQHSGDPDTAPDDQPWLYNPLPTGFDDMKKPQPYRFRQGEQPGNACTASVPPNWLCPPPASWTGHGQASHLPPGLVAGEQC